MQEFNEPIEPDAIFNADGSRAESAGSAGSAEAKPPRTLYWHVFGSALNDKRRGKNNYMTVTAGPVAKQPDSEVRNTTIPGEHGAFFRYIGSFDHEPTNQDIFLLRPQEYR